jgi:hypothetical protein
MQKNICFSLIIFTLYISPLAWAQSIAESTDATSNRAPVQVTEFPKEIRTENTQGTQPNFLSFSFQNQAYLQSSELADAAEQIFNLKHQFKYSKGYKKTVSSLILGGYANNNSIYLAVPELYFQYSIPNSENTIFHTYSIGRKKMDASQSDQKFNLGLTNSFFTQDYIHYEHQGLVGLHQDLSTRNFGFSLSALPIYLPNQGPTIKESNGKVFGSNRWIKKPPEKFAFNDNNKEIIYSIRYDEVSKLVFSPGGYAQFRIGQLNDHLHLISSFARRPMNDPVLERETFADLDVIGNVNLVPNIIYDETMTTDLRFANNKMKTSISYISDRPENKKAREFYSIQNLNAISGYSFNFEYSTQALNQRDISLGFGVAEFQGGEIVDVNADGTENIFTFTKQRLQYKRPVQLYLNSDLFFFRNGRTLKTKIHWLYDLEQNGSVLTSELSTQAYSSLNAKLGIEVLGTQEERVENFGFLQQFQSNDRVYGGLEYVF